MDISPKVSIIIPLYNSEDNIYECLKSAMNQTAKNIEIIVVNDGSTDKSGEISEQLANSDQRVTVIHQENLGAGPARNKGMEMAKGEYLYFLDSDDKINPKLVEENLKILVQSEVDILIFGYTKKEKSAGKKIDVNTRLKDCKLDSKQEIRKNLCEIFERGATFAVWNKIFRRKLIEKNSVRYPNMKRNQDMAFTLDAIKYANSITVNSSRYYNYSFDSNTQKYDPNLIAHHIMIYKKFYSLHDNWMEIDNNRTYAVRLFTLYFFHSYTPLVFFFANINALPVQRHKVWISNRTVLSYI